MPVYRMFCSWEFTTTFAPILCTKLCHLPLHSNHSVPAPVTLAIWIPMKTVPTWPAVTTIVGFEVQEHPLPADTTAGPSGDGHRSQRQRERSERFRLQGVKAYWAYAVCTMPHTSEPYIKSQLSPTATTTSAMSVLMVLTDHPSQTL